MPRDIALAIGVGNAKKLPPLGGAINGARSFHHWASQLGYESFLLTDESETVTIDRFRMTLNSILTPTAEPIHRFVIYFAGHGLIREAEERLWLLSDWHDDLRAVAVEGLKRRLYMHEIGQISIFADACQSLPPNIEAADLTADAVLGRGPYLGPVRPAIDKFAATQDGRATFMIPGPSPDEDRCLFSGVLLEALWGTQPAAFSRVLPGVITSRSLGSYLQTTVPRIAEKYKQKVYPTVAPGFPEEDDTYWGLGPRPAPPSFPDWPSPETVAAMGLTSPQEGFESLNPEDLGEAGHAFSTDRNRPTLADRIQRQTRPPGFETGSGFAVEGGRVRTCWTPSDVFAEPHGNEYWWRLGQVQGYQLARPIPVLVEFEDGLFAAITALPDFIATVLRHERGVSALVYRETHAPADTAAVVEAALSQMENGALRSQDAPDLAVQLRQLKHLDPVLGVITAYLYDSIGDIDSIRRMAYYYIEHAQPIPYDIALLAQLRGERRGDGRLCAHVPEVAPCKPRTEAEERNEWTHSATRAAVGEVAGLWPWMRQGWPLLDDPADDGSTLIVPGLIESRRFLKPSRFAAFDEEGGRHLIRLFNLSNRGIP